MPPEETGLLEDRKGRRQDAKQTRSKKLRAHNKSYIPGGVVSVNRAIQPEIAFERGEGSKYMGC